MYNNNSIQLAGMPDYTYYFPVEVHRLQNALSIEGHETSSEYPFLLVIMDGSIRLVVNGFEQSLKGRSVLLCERGSRLQLIEKHVQQAFLIEYNYTTLNHSAPRPLPCSRSPLSCSYRAAMLAIELYTAWQLRSQHPYQAQRLFLELIEQVQLELEEAVYQGSDWLQSVLSHIHMHYREELTREQLAALGSISPEHFSRTFHKQIGSTFSSYMNTLRIRDVQQQLLTGNSSNLHDLAQKVGYKDGYYLSRKFKQVVGISPTTFLRKPKRILSTNYNYTAMLLTLQTQPVLGAYSTYLQAQYPSAPNDQDHELNWDGNSYEQVQTLMPDVVIGFEKLSEDMTLKSIAPVVAIPFMRLDWREQFRQIAEIAGKQQHAEYLLEQYNLEVKLANTQLDEVLGGRGSLIIWEIQENIAYAFGNRYGRGGHVLYDDLGFDIPDQLIQEGIYSTGYIQATLDQICHYPADYIVLLDLPHSPQTEHLFRSPDWLAMEAVKQQRVVILKHADLFYGFDPQSTLQQLELLMANFTS
ncbi:ABC transporter substrate-binding protein [Paenibacillus gorillae]|uniref:ABC transporter substrate-binding protein n=1 Tax=Paenibacillus gorillae TaxID=1243662 RepID=UPI0004AE4557|nr:ABC transporter substrate-binding protein [Paenibacillus gorillae]